MTRDQEMELAERFYQALRKDMDWAEARDVLRAARLAVRLAIESGAIRAGDSVGDLSVTIQDAQKLSQSARPRKRKQ
jgi:hypothetical protein